MPDNRPEALAQRKLQELTNKSLKQNEMAVLQPMRRTRAAHSQPAAAAATSSNASEERSYESTSSIAAGTTCFRFIILLNDEEPDTGHRPFTDDNEGGVSLTLDPSKTPKGRPLKGRWKATYRLKNDMTLYHCKNKQSFEPLLIEKPNILCFTNAEAELKCRAAAFWNIFDLVGWEKHQPPAQEAPAAVPAAAAAEAPAQVDESRFSRFNAETGFLDTDYDALFEDRWKRREVKFIAAAGLSQQFSAEEAAKFPKLGGRVTDKSGAPWSVVHFDETKNIYYIKPGW